MTKQEKTDDVIELPEVLDVNALEALHPELLSKRGSELCLDASALSAIGAQGLQLLLSAAETWRSDGEPFVIRNAHEDVLTAISLMGIEADTLSLEGGKHE